jgi:hypothetical protein
VTARPPRRRGSGRAARLGIWRFSATRRLAAGRCGTGHGASGGSGPREPGDAAMPSRVTSWRPLHVPGLPGAAASSLIPAPASAYKDAQAGRRVHLPSCWRRIAATSSALTPCQWWCMWICGARSNRGPLRLGERVGGPRPSLAPRRGAGRAFVAAAAHPVGHVGHEGGSRQAQEHSGNDEQDVHRPGGGRGYGAAANRHH